MGRGARITHDPEQLQILRRIHLLGQIERRASRFNTMADRPAYTSTTVRSGYSRSRRILQPVGRLWIVDYRTESRIALRQRNHATDVVLAGGLAGQQDAAESGMAINSHSATVAQVSPTEPRANWRRAISVLL